MDLTLPEEQPARAQSRSSYRLSVQLLRKMPRSQQERVWRPGMVVLLFLLWPMFMQCFAYTSDAPLLYALSKIWPVLSLPLAAWALLRLKLNGAWVVSGLLIYALFLTPVLAMIQLGINLTDALSSSVKMWVFLHYFAAAGLLTLLRPSRNEIERSLLALGIFTFLVLWVLWSVMPASAYQTDPLLSQVFFADLERGNRIYAPMPFGFFLIFYLNRSYWAYAGWWKLVAVGFAFFSLVHIYKEKLSIAVVVLIVLFGALSAFRRQRMTLVGLGFLAAGIGGAIALVTVQPEQLARVLGGSLATRQLTGALALDFLQVDPLRWVFGVGSMTKHGEIGMDQLFRFNMFYLSDIGWLGVLFEYGIIGVTLVALVCLHGFRITMRGAKVGDIMSLSLLDSVLYVLLTQTIYSPIQSPGMLMTWMALSFCLPLMATQRLKPTASRNSLCSQSAS